MRQFEKQLLEAKDWLEVRPKLEVKRLPHPDGKGHEPFGLCRSPARREKEKARLARQEARLWQKLWESHQRPLKKPAPAEGLERRVGQWLGRSRAAKLFEVEVCWNDQRQACGLSVACVVDRRQWVAPAQGAYWLRPQCQAVPQPAPRSPVSKTRTVTRAACPHACTHVQEGV